MLAGVTRGPHPRSPRMPHLEPYEGVRLIQLVMITCCYACDPGVTRLYGDSNSTAGRALPTPGPQQISVQVEPCTAHKGIAGTPLFSYGPTDLQVFPLIVTATATYRFLATDADTFECEGQARAWITARDRSDQAELARHSHYGDLHQRQRRRRC